MTADNLPRVTYSNIGVGFAPLIRLAARGRLKTRPYKEILFPLAASCATDQSSFPILRRGGF